jgi:hypothetical protein
MINEDGTTQRIERRFDRRGEKKDRVKPVKKFDDKKFNKSKHITKKFDEEFEDFEEFDEEFEDFEEFKEIKFLDDSEFNFSTNGSEPEPNSVYEYDSESIFSTYDNNDRLFGRNFNKFFFFDLKCPSKNHKIIIDRTKIIIDKLKIEKLDLFKKISSSIYHKYKNIYDLSFFSLKEQFIEHLSLFFNEKSINISYYEIIYLLEILFDIGKSDEKYQFIFTNYRNITLYIFNKMINFESYLKKKKQYLLFFIGFEEGKIPWIPIQIQNNIMSFIA